MTQCTVNMYFVRVSFVSYHTFRAFVAGLLHKYLQQTPSQDNTNFLPCCRVIVVNIDLLNCHSAVVIADRHSSALRQIMPPKNPKAAKSKQKVLEDQIEEVLQAVVSALCLAASDRYIHFNRLIDSIQVLADSFETRFSPFTLQRPRVGTFQQDTVLKLL